MDRNETVRISRLAAFGGLTHSDVSIVLTQYCLEHNKPPMETLSFVTYVLSNNSLTNYCFNIALSYYERKFTIRNLYKIPSLLDNQRQGKILIQIF